MWSLGCTRHCSRHWQNNNTQKIQFLCPTSFQSKRKYRPANKPSEIAMCKDISQGENKRVK